MGPLAYLPFASPPLSLDATRLREDRENLGDTEDSRLFVLTRRLARAVSTTNARSSSTVSYMARPRLYEERVTTAVRLPEELHRRLQDAADERDVSVNLLVVKAVERYLEQLIPLDQVMVARPA